MSALRLRFLRKGLSSSVTYDTSIGNGVDVNGFASLPLRAGGKRFFVNSSTGNDANNITQAQVPATPVATIAAAVAFVTNGAGDQILLAEGTTYAAGIPNLNNCSGFSAVYPFVIQTYDPADALNTVKYGRGDQRSARPTINTGATADQFVTGSALAPSSYLVIKGFNVNPGNIGSMDISLSGSNSLSNNYVLFENNLFNYTSVVIQQTDTSPGTNFIFRNNASNGTWDGVGTSPHGLLVGAVNGLTVEDNVFSHNGWKTGASRDDSQAAGGANIAAHPMYLQHTTTATVRRNLVIDGSGDGGSLRGPTTATQNLIIDCPIAILGGDSVATSKVELQYSYNAILGDADANSSSLRGYGFWMNNGTTTSSVNHNLIARSRNPNAAQNASALRTNPDYAGFATNMIFDHNIAYLWSSSGHSTETSGTTPTPANVITYTNNYWDDPASGSNLNISSLTPPNAYTASTLYSALTATYPSITDKASLISYAIAHPEAHVQRLAVNLLLTGYGVNTSAMPYLPNS